MRMHVMKIGGTRRFASENVKRGRRTTAPVDGNAALSDVIGLP